MRTNGEPADFFYHLDDPAFLEERARLRSRLEHVPENAIGRPGLERLYEAMTEEFCRRARLAWTRGRLPPGTRSTAGSSCESCFARSRPTGSGTR